MRNHYNLLKHTSTSLLFVMAFAFAAQGQATRTWVSGVGDDVNPCSRTAPCKTFAGAISKTAKNGEIDALDPGGFGTITITKSITIDGVGTNASILAALTTGVIINITDPADTFSTVTLRNLTINGASTGINGIRILSAKKVIIENCIIFGFKGASFPSGNGITDVRNTPTVTTGTLSVTNTNITDNNTWGILVNPGANSTVNASFNNLNISNNNFGGVALSTRAIAMLRDSAIFGNTSNGVYAENFGGTVELNIENSSITSNGTGVNKGPGSPTIRLSNVHVTGNGTGLTGGAIVSYGNNRLQGNTAGNGLPVGSPAALGQQ